MSENKVDKIFNDLCYLDWYFDEDNEKIDKEAVAAYNNLRPIIFNWIEKEKRKPRYIHLYTKEGKEIK